MPLFTIDPETCNRDGLCVATCPVKIIELRDDADTPNPTAGADET